MTTTTTEPTTEPTKPAGRFSLRRVTGGRATAPLLLLFGLNAVDELDRSAFAVLTPTIRDHFELDTQGILGVITLVYIVALGAQVFIGYYADRYPRLRIAVAGASLWGLFTLGTGIAPTIALLVVARSLSGIGRAVNDPTHNSLLADYYPPEVRTSVYGLHRAANPAGMIIGPALGGLLSHLFGWRAPFLVFWIPTAVLVTAVLLKLREPVRGEFERRSMGADEEVATTEETPPSFAEGWRICNQVMTLRRIFYSLPFLAAALLGLTALTSILYRDVFDLNDAERGVLFAFVEPFQLAGIVLGIPIAMRVARRGGPGYVLRFLAIVATLSAIFLVGLAQSPNLPMTIVFNVLVQATLGVLVPGIYSTLSLVLPPRARALGFSIGSLYVLIGVPVIAIIGGFADSIGIRSALVVLAPVFLVGAYILASAGAFVATDIDKVRASTTAQAEVLAARRRGQVKLLLVKDLDVAYDTVQVLFKVDFEVDEGEIIALLGTNGAGKSTLLRAISGLQPAIGGAVIFDGVDMTYAPPQEIASRGVVQVPGGKGVFPGLSVRENLEIAGWLYRREGDYVQRAIEQVLDYFPVLRARWDQPAGNLSGGEQQMLTLGQAFIARPRLLMIDELSLGLAPIVVEQLLEIVKAIRDRGTTIILVEQSVNVALTIAETAFFMEKGEIRFRGPTSDLLERPDILRSVFLEGAGTIEERTPPDRAPARAKRLAESNGSSKQRVVLRANGLMKRFGGIAATDDVSFELHENEIVGFIGPNGAGKTTLFDLLSGFLPADAGRIWLHGDDITEFAPDARARLGLGRSFQDARLFPALTVYETIALALERHVDVRDPVAAALHLPVVADSEQATRERVDELIDVMGLGAFANKFVSELSTGSRRIVDLACVLAHEPTVILFDEPSSGIAQRETEALGPLLLRIRESTSASLLVIEHDMPLITSISDRIVALDLGAVITEGPPDEVVNHPHVIRSYLGTNEDVVGRSSVSATATSAATSTATSAATTTRRRARRSKEQQ